MLLFQNCKKDINEQSISIVESFQKGDIEKIKEVELLLNYRPIRKFNYNNPIEVLNNKCVALMSWTQQAIKKEILLLNNSIQSYSKYKS